VKVLVTGASGLLGAHIAAALVPVDDVLGLDRHPWWGDQPLRFELGDLEGGDAIEHHVVRFRPDLVFHCAALVNVDACEQSPAQAFAANAGLPGRLARAVAPDCLFVYIGTDGVFRGNSAFADEEMLPEPRTVYGRSKFEGEREVQRATPNHLILRTNFFGWSSGRKPTSAEWLYDALERQQPITLFEDFYFTPVYVVDFVSAMLRLIDGGVRGLIHLTGGERVSKFDFGMTMARQAGFSTTQVRRGSIEEAALLAPRPRDMSLSTARAASLLGHELPSAAAGIQRFLQDRHRPLSERGAAAVHGRGRV
jgi:dTDP-4-dehydrorhamnose reductase